MLGDTVRTASYSSTWAWLWILLAIPAVILLLEHVGIPWATQRLLQGRGELRSLSLLGGLHDLVWQPTEGPRWRFRQIYLVIHWPDLLKRRATTPSRVQWLTLRIEGVEVDLVLRPSAPPAAKEAPADTNEPSSASTSSHPHGEGISHTSQAALLAHTSASPWHQAQHRWRELRHIMLRRTKRFLTLVIESIGALSANFIAVEVCDVRVRPADTAVALQVDYARWHASVLLAYAARRLHRLAQTVSDGFADAPTQAMHTRSHGFFGLNMRAPEGRLRVQLDVEGIRLQHHENDVVAMPGRSSFSVRTKFKEYIVRESAMVRLELADLHVDADALQHVRSDITAWKHASIPTESPASQPSRPPTPTPPRWLAYMRSIVLNLGKAHIVHHLPGDSDDELRLELKSLRVSLENSDPSHSVHQAWFGACGRGKGHNASLFEARRIFYLQWSLAHIKTVLHMEHSKHRSLLLSFTRLHTWCRTSFTPYGVLPAEAQHGRPPLFFDTDPNEPMVTLRMSLEHIRSAPDLTSLSRVSSALRRARPSTPSSSQGFKFTGPQWLPRVAMVFQIGAVDVVVHQGRSAQLWDAERRALAVSIPQLHIELQGSYGERVRVLRDSQLGNIEAIEAHKKYPLRYVFDASAGIAAIDAYLTMPHVGGRPTHHDVLNIGAIGFEFASRIPTAIDIHTWRPRINYQAARSRTRLSVQHIDVNVWHAFVVETLLDVLRAIFHVRPMDSSPPPSAPVDDGTTYNPPKSFMNRLPTLHFMHMGVGRVSVYLGGHDSHFEPSIRRGIALVIGSTVLDYSRANQARPLDVFERTSKDARQALRLPEHIGTRARALAYEDGSGAAIVGSMHDISLFPLVDIGAAASHAENAPREDDNDTGIYVEDQWDFTTSFDHLLREPRHVPRLHQLQDDSQMVHIPALLAEAECRNAHPNIAINARTEGSVTMRIVLVNTYCLLVSISAIRTLLEACRRPRPATVPPLNDEKPSPSPDKPRMTVHVMATVPRIHLYVWLPHDRQIFLYIKALHVRKRQGIRVALDSLHACLPQEKHRSEAWDDAVVFRRFAVSLGEQTDSPKTIFVTGDSLHARIPYLYYSHLLIEGSVVAFKATKQLVYQFILGYNQSAIYPHNEAPKRLPHISLRIGIAVIEAADEALDSKLNLIFRAGGDEQLMRMERLRLFEQRLAQTDPEAVPDNTRERLDALNSSNWIRRIHNARNVRAARERAFLSYIHHRVVDLDEVTHEHIPIEVRSRPSDPPLARLTMTKLSLDISQPTGYQLEDTHTWLHTQAGNPVDLEYTTLVPLHVRWRLSEAIIRLRDYPLPLLHIPPRTDMEPCFDAEGDICVAEQLGDEYSVRHVRATIVPAIDATGSVEHGLMVPKSCMTPKVYGPVTVHVSSSRPTIFSWGQSMQPTIQDLKAVIDAITSPPRDPSPKPGPWDKLPLHLQGSMHIFFDNDVHLHLKGARDPYYFLQGGAGWVLAWRKNVEVRLGVANPDHEFLQVRSGEHLLAIPQLKHMQDMALTGLYDVERGVRTTARAVLERLDTPVPATFAKISWQLSGGVRWGMGLASEHTCTEKTCERTPKCEGTPFYRKCRFFGRKPHWQVLLRSREGYDRLPESQRGDSYYGWRSDFVHLSVSLQAIGDGDLYNSAMQLSRNSVYITPKSWDHFMEWCRLFNGRLSLPIRQGNVFPKAPGVKSPKFGLHLGTIKYRFNIAPLQLSHVYRQRLRYDYKEALRSYVGVKAKAGMFYLDLHQRMQETVHQPPVEGAKPTRSLRKPLYEAEADISDLELWCLCARFRETYDSVSSLPATPDMQFDPLASVFSKSEQQDTEHPVYDRLDYYELGDLPVEEKAPKLHIQKALTLARFNFHRLVEWQAHVVRRSSKASTESVDPVWMPRSDSPETTSSSHDAPSEPTRQSSTSRPPFRKMTMAAPPLTVYSKFGHEGTHTCLIGRSRQVMDDHLDLEHQRLRHLDGDILVLQKMLEQNTMPGDSLYHEQQERLHRLQMAGRDIKAHIDRIMEHRTEKDAIQGEVPQYEVDRARHANATGQSLDEDASQKNPSALRKEWESFNNQILAYRPVVMLNNLTRDILMRYYDSSLYHRGLSQRLSVSEQYQVYELLERARLHLQRSMDADNKADPSTLLEDMIADTTRLSSKGMEHTFLSDYGAEHSESYEPGHGISDMFSLRKKTICVCVQPELILHSHVGENSTLVFHARQLRVRNYAVSDSMYDERSINHNVMHRNFIAMQSLQCYHSVDAIEEDETQSTLESLRLPAEVLNGLHQPRFQRLIRETHAFVLYDKHNRLRLQDPSRPVIDTGHLDDTEVNYLSHNMDLVQILCPRFTLTANSEQFAAIYNVVTDLVLYTDPLQKELERRRDSLLYSYQFNDPDFVVSLIAAHQVRIHDLSNQLRAYEAQFDALNNTGINEYVLCNVQLIDLYVNMCMLEEAVFISHSSSRDKSKHSALLLRACAESIEWNMIADDGPTDADVKDIHGLFARLHMQGTAYSRMALASGMSINCVNLQNMEAHNAHPSAYFEEILTKYQPRQTNSQLNDQKQFLLAHWLMPVPAGGVGLIDKCELHMHPVKVQLELRVGRQLWSYLFSSRNAKQAQAREEQEEENVDEHKKRKWFKQIVSMSRKARHTVASPVSLSDSDSDSDSDSGSEANILLPASPVIHHSNESIMTQRSAMQGGSEHLHTDAVDLEAFRDEMLRRAGHYMSFVHVMVAAMAVCLSYKGDGDHSLTNLYDLEFLIPKLEYNNILGTYGDLTDLIRKDMIKIAWDHRSTLLKGVISTHTRKHAALKKSRADRMQRFNVSSREEWQRQMLQDPRRMSNDAAILMPPPAPPPRPPSPDRMSMASSTSMSKQERLSMWRHALASRIQDVADDTASVLHMGSQSPKPTDSEASSVNSATLPSSSSTSSHHPHSGRLRRFLHLPKKDH
ncbi:hypothetical protein ACI68E_004074 [Malassezia pachydermatis]|uniref:Uncharacterized protein n=1 Tax=Malassezia pachydermatis TaxID=77020 RepID=A0A0M8MHF8_9BASI|nr:hypothetical protein Malapachy_2826 [Malassezia pachydermatis]KOS12526.1 hypothetical protein Malapachy_2826 [Malassezia pachydermatis]